MQMPASGRVAISAQFTGTATLWTNYRGAEGPITKEVSIQLWFDEDRTKIMIHDMSPIKTDPFDTPLGKNVTTVTLINQAAGTFDPAYGTIRIPVRLLIDHSIDIPIYKEDSTLEIVLSTESVTSPLGNAEGSRLNETGQVTLVGASQFNAGILNGYWGVVVITGVISPHP